MPFSKDLLIGASGNQGAGVFYEYQIEQSIRLDRSTSSSGGTNGSFLQRGCSDIPTPSDSKKFTFSTWLKKLSSGLKVIFVPVFLWPNLSISFSSFFLRLFAKDISNFFPSLLISAFNFFDKAFTTETPTPCKPPENVYSLLVIFAPA